jgi:2-phospho-L-lactate/phosphoenolpyruvate guanylyltransferase
MSLWAIIPVKPLRRGKSRLAGTLSEDERAVLNYTMLNNTLKTLKSVRGINEIIVVSRDPAALSLAREHHARTVKEDGSPELNLALKRATGVALAYNARSILILPADIPLISEEVIAELLAKAGTPPEIVITPDRRGDGTNAMLISPPGIMNFSYGPSSFNLHVKQAQEKGITIKVFRHPSLELDLDLPEDLEILRKMETYSINS